MEMILGSEIIILQANGVAYHGVARFHSPDIVKQIIGNIIKDSFKKGIGQSHRDCDDIFHPGKKVGEGVYFFQNIKVAEEYAGITIISGIAFKAVLMVRARPDAIRGCNCNDNLPYWVLNGTTDEIRPYRILYKQV